MKVIPIKPFGYCEGVTHAIELAYKEAENSNNQVYCLGLLVHNELAVKALKEKGIIVLSEKEKTLEEHIKSIPANSTLIFSAHGHDNHLEEIAKRKQLRIIDATCRFVKENLRSALDYPSDVIYIGLSDHLESIGFLANCPKASFFDVKEMKLSLKKEFLEKPLVITQTTLSSSEITKALEIIKERFPDALLGQERCHSTSLRQKAINDLEPSVRQIIILGSKFSNNTKKLHEIALAKGLNAHLCLDLNEVKLLQLDKNEPIALSSGASTSRETFLEVKNYLESL